ncbi:DUF1553 domain-containing protein [Stieleria sp. TO1_6]|uniref:DUF1553 domain-containing protein n=1 Tax=Stieleria tagensis TaxID=2956795 RepID=UPI00209AE9B3|nr:DUF1553 domain-containing protein [Stieleria tagensis]MCO8124544.1 DUF1553 domain-containing protein [Stieleria tagensis]
MPSQYFIFGIVRVCCVVSLASSVYADVDFNRDVRPILADNCFECHGPDAESREADLRLDALEEAMGWVIEPGKSNESSLIERLLSDAPDAVMPPPHSKRRPTKKQIQILKDWIDQGAEYERHWAFAAPITRALPKTVNANWPRNPIDSFVASHLDAESLKPRHDAEPRVLARRLSLALTGLPILPNEGNAFADDFQRNPDQAISSLVDKLLASEAYGEHRAWYWMDAARYADTNGYQADGHRVMWPWRDWLIRNLNANLPFDKLTEQMLAGDLMIPKEHQHWQSADWIADDRSRDYLIATGFLRNHRYDTGSGTIPAESKFENAADRMETVATVWMGMTMLCARCHTHKYDPIENREYYELLSFFDNVREAGSALKLASHPYIHTPTQKEQARLKQLQQATDAADAAMLAAESSIAEAQQKWESKVADVVRVPLEEGSVTRSAPKTRVTRGLKFHYAETPLHLDGNTSIEKPNDAIALCAGNRRWTISFWFRPESDKGAAIFSSVEEPERYRQGIQADWVNGKIRVRHVCRWVNSYIEFESAQTLRVGKWHHVTFRCDGRMQGIAYSASIDGSDDAMLCTHPVTNDSADNAGKAKLVLGGSPFLANFSGDLRDLRFYDRELNVSEVRSLADARTINEIARVPVNNRTHAERETLRLAFLEDDSLPAYLRELYNARIAAHAKLDEAIFQSPTTMVMKEGRTKHTQIRLAGVFNSLGDKVATDTPDFLPPLPQEHPNRLALAHWLTHPDHPLTARVAVNRIWQTLWGRGFTDSPENFGTQTGEPLHAELLDWLATEYVRLGWDTKALIKLIVTSRTYRQSSDASEAMWASDPANRHLARGPRFRLPVHTVRDQALFLSGLLDNTVGGPPVIIDDVIGQNGKIVKLPYEMSNHRRTLYTFWKRNSPHPMLAVFDVADRNQCEVRTMRTNTPLQALVTLNEPGFAASAKDLSERAQQAAQTEPEQLGWLWHACTGRIPSDEELRQLQTIRKDYLEIADSNQSQAWTALCNVLLNLDATMTLE